ncbi:helix-turn-helix domain-containing protein [Cohnella caldifontis]|uniref:helix-turn-helix domain-containing protein n=1 Tax=Cohnella caldifontis TaxID=3027471 RepID=UPI0023EC19B1|nr:helix-turn-helix transcriptional regulator [Cohnella sp. YIM B05605]
MDDPRAEIAESISYMQRNLYEPLTLSDIARHVGYSPAHFLRLFKSQTGLPPHYYLSSVRLQRAKDLLLHTRLPVRDIAQEIGQQSLGTFTTRFTEKVGVTPAGFRNQLDTTESQLDLLKRLEEGEYAKQIGIQRGAKVAGRVFAETPFEGIVFIGLFRKPIPESFPVHGTLLLSRRDYQFTNVRPGIYFLMATTVAWGMKSKEILLPKATLRSRRHEPLTVGASEDAILRNVTLHAPRFDDPPILISLPLLMSRFIARTNPNGCAHFRN